MPTYGKIKINTLTYDDSGSAVDLAINNIAVKADPAFTGTINGASLILSGDLTVNGTTTTIDTTTLQVEDKNIEIGKVSTPSNTTADGGGITLLGGSDGNKTINWVNSTDAWTFSENINIAAGKKLGVGGSSYGTSGHVLTSGGSGAAPTWSALPAAGSTVSLVADGAIGNNVACNVKSNGKVEAVTEVAASFNTVATGADGGYTYPFMTYDKEHNLFVLFFRHSSDLKIRIGTPTGTGATSNVSWSSTQTIYSSSSDHMYIGAAYIDFNNTNKHVVAWRDSGGTMHVGCIDVAANGTVTVGSSTSAGACGPKRIEVANGNETSYPFLIFYKKSSGNDELQRRDGQINTGTNVATAAGAGNILGGSSDNFNDPIFAFQWKNIGTTVMAKNQSNQWMYATRLGGNDKATVNFGPTGVTHLQMFYDALSDKVFAFYRESGGMKYDSGTPNASTGVIAFSGSPTTKIASNVNNIGSHNSNVAYDTLNSKYWWVYTTDSPQNTYLWGFTIAANGTITWDASAKGIGSDINPIGAWYESSLRNIVASGGTNTRTSYGASSTMDLENFLGYSSAAYSDGDTSEIKVTGNTVSGLSSLTPGKKYYVQRDGSVSLTPVAGLSVEAGLALTSTSLLIKG